MLISSFISDIDNQENDSTISAALMAPPHRLSNNIRGFQRSRRRRRIHNKYLLSVTFIAVALCFIMSKADASKHSKWLQNRLRQLAAPHMETFTPIDPAESKTNSFAQESSEMIDTPLIVVATHEGQVWTIDSRDGNLIAGFSTGSPLMVIDDHYEEANAHGESFPPAFPSSLSQSHIVPSLDGILYWQQPNDADTNNKDAPKLVPIASIRDLVDNPIQMCHELDEENCDILTATNLGPSLFSLNSQGSLNWARARGTSTAVSTFYSQKEYMSGSSDSSESDTENDSQSHSSSSTTASSSRRTSLLLQRQDYLVQQISTQTGEQVWNITWGSLEALDFMGQSDPSSSGSRRAQGSRHLPSGDSPSSSLPSVIFANEGRSLVAVFTQPPKFLWKRDFPSVVTNVLGIEHNAWQALNVADQDNDVEDARRQSQWSGRQRHPRLPAAEQPEYQQEEVDYWYWWWTKGAGRKKDDIEFNNEYIQQQKQNGLIYVAKPDPEKLVRNNWYLNHLWESLRSPGRNTFQRLLVDRPHENDGSDEDVDEVMAFQTEQGGYQYPSYQRNSFYDTSSMPRVILLPPSESPNLELPSPPSAGGVFLSWSLVMTIITMLSGTAGAAYIIYGQKKRKWIAKANEESKNNNRIGNAPEMTNATSSSLPGTNVRGRSISTGSYDDPNALNDSSRSREKIMGSDDIQHAMRDLSGRFSSGRITRATLNRCSTAPLMSRDEREVVVSASTQESVASKTTHSIELSPSRRASSAIEGKRNEEARAAPGRLVKHQSAPVEAAPEEPQGGVGMIDGIPLIRYSRYQSEFREVEPLGRGGFGTVFRCSNVLDGRQYAVKKVYIRSSHDSNAPGTEAFSQELHRVLREVKFLALLDHPNIVRYYTAWLEMEEKDKIAPVDENANSKTLSRKFSSGLLTSLDATNTDVESPATFGNAASKSTVSKSHLKLKNIPNPLGWNDFDNFIEESVSYRPKSTKPLLPTMEDCGFIFEEASEDIAAENDTPSFYGNAQASQGHSASSSNGSRSNFSQSISSSWDASYSTNRRNKEQTIEQSCNNMKASKALDVGNKKALRHTLYIQMQLCSSKTLADFLANPEARKGPAADHQSSPAREGSVDIPYALRLFNQIVKAVYHVHQQGLIHRYDR